MIKVKKTVSRLTPTTVRNTPSVAITQQSSHNNYTNAKPPTKSTCHKLLNTLSTWIPSMLITLHPMELISSKRCSFPKHKPFLNRKSKWSNWLALHLQKTFQSTQENHSTSTLKTGKSILKKAPFFSSTSKKRKTKKKSSVLSLKNSSAPDPSWA